MLPPWIFSVTVRYGAAIALGAACAWWVQGLRWEVDVAQYRQAQAVADVTAELNRQRTERVMQYAREEAERLAADAAGAVRSRDRLQQQLNEYVNAATGGSPTTCPAAGVLAELFRRADEAAGRMAEYADRAAVAGRACERLGAP